MEQQERAHWAKLTSAWTWLTAHNKTRSRHKVFVYELTWLAILWTLAALHIEGDLHVPSRLVGSLPVGVLWFGALGAVLISISAVFDFSGAAWDPRWELWHYSRPVVGASVGVVAVLMFQAGIASLNTGAKLTAGNHVAYYLIAFLVGYREETFRDLVKKLVDVVLTPTGGTAPTLTAVTPSHGVMGVEQEVALTGTGLAEVVSVHVAGTAIGWEDVTDTHLILKVPSSPTAGVVPITVETKQGSAATVYTYDA